MQTQPKTRLSRLMMATLAGTIALGGVAATMARAENDNNDAAQIQALAAAKVTLADAIRKAEAAGQGVVIGAGIETDTAGDYFKVTTLNGTTETDHKIDLMTGDILASTPNDEKADSDGDNDGDKAGGESGGEYGEKAGDKDQAETDETAAIQGAKVGLLQAVTEAEALGNKVLSVEYGHENAVLAIDLTLVDATGKVSEVLLDAANNIAISDEAEGEEGEKDEANGG